MGSPSVIPTVDNADSVSAIAASILHSAESIDPITAFLTQDWAAFGGWSLFIGLGIYMVLGSIREWWVPGRRYRRLEESAVKLTDANIELTKQNGQLIQANEITKHFFQETVPKRGEPT